MGNESISTHYIPGRAKNVVNVDCSFKAGWFSFTHGNYWQDKRMFAEIIEEFLYPPKPPLYP